MLEDTEALDIDNIQIFSSGGLMGVRMAPWHLPQSEDFN